MYKRSVIFCRKLNWFTNRTGVKSGIPQEVGSWIYETASLTQRLKKNCGVNFRVKVLSQQWVKPWPGEARVLQLGMNQYALVREVQLFCHKQPLIVARTVIPPDTLKGAQRRLSSLGTRPLGEVIFTYPGLQRHRLDITKVKLLDWRQALLNSLDIHEEVWGRRTVYGIANRKLLVCEFFLPAVVRLR